MSPIDYLVQDYFFFFFFLRVKHERRETDYFHLMPEDKSSPM